MPAPLLEYVTEEDFLNGQREKVNAAIAAIPVEYVVSNDGTLTITRKNGATDTIQLQNFFALLGTIFDEFLPGTATPEAPGTVTLADPENPTHLDSNTRVLSAAAVVAILEQYLVDVGGDLEGTLNNGREGFGSIILQEGAQNAYPRIILKVKDDADNQYETSSFGPSGNRSTDIRHNGQAVVDFDALTARLFSQTVSVSNDLTAKDVFIEAMPLVDQALYFTMSVYSNKHNAWQQVRANIANSAKILNAIINNGTFTVWGKSIVIKETKAFLGSPQLFYVPSPTPTGNPFEGNELQVASAQQVALSLFPHLSSLLGGGGGSPTDNRVNTFLGCVDEEEPPANEETIVLQAVGLGVGNTIDHNLQTAELGYMRGYRLDNDEEQWYPEYELATYLKFQEDTIYIKSTAPASYGTGTFKIYLERINRV